MNIHGIGTDILKIIRIKQIFYKKYFTRFCQRILTLSELKEFHLLQTIDKQTLFLAKRFAAKEALLKAVGTGYRMGIAFNEIDILKNKYGKPEAYFTGSTLSIVQKLLNKDFISFISWSDEDQYIVAFAVIQINN